MSQTRGVIFYDQRGNIQRIWEPDKPDEWEKIIAEKMGHDFLALLKKHNVKFTEDGDSGGNQ